MDKSEVLRRANGISDEERVFSVFLKCAMELGLLEGDIIYQPDSFMLIPKTMLYTEENNKVKVKSLYRKHIYTPDFKFEATDGIKKLFGKHLHSSSDGFFYVDTKGGFNREQRSFSIDQKLVMDKHNVIINKVIPYELMKKIGVAPHILLYHNRKPRKDGTLPPNKRMTFAMKCISLREYIDINK